MARPLSKEELMEMGFEAEDVKELLAKQNEPAVKSLKYFVYLTDERKAEILKAFPTIEFSRPPKYKSKKVEKPTQPSVKK